MSHIAHNIQMSHRIQMKKRVAIYVDGTDWKSVRIRAVELGMSAGGYLIGLHLKALGVIVIPAIEGVSARVNELPKEKVISAEAIERPGRVMGYSKARQLGREEKQ